MGDQGYETHLHGSLDMRLSFIDIHQPTKRRVDL
jgi:hypothetical protein